jgi:hypothetical protein
MSGGARPLLCGSGVPMCSAGGDAGEVPVGWAREHQKFNKMHRLFFTEY